MNKIVLNREKYSEKMRSLKMKRNERIGAMIKILISNPNRIFTLNYFTELFYSAKSSISEDIAIAKKTMSNMNLGRIETIPGAAGGVKYVAEVSDEDIEQHINYFCGRLKEEHRILAGGFLYTSDLMYDPSIVKRSAEIFASKFKDSRADYIVTVETKGIPVAFETANLLNIPLVVIRRESKISEGSTVSINYVSGSSKNIQKMSMAKRAVTEGSKAIIIDDFMKGGGTARGIYDMMKEFEIDVVGTGVLIATKEPERKLVDNYISLMILDEVDALEKIVKVFPSTKIFK